LHIVHKENRMRQRIDVIDDDPGMRDSLVALLVAAGYEADVYASAKTFLENYHPGAACVITDVQMPEMDGRELQAVLATRGDCPPIIVMTGHGSVPLAVQSLQAGAADFIEKPFDSARLLESITRALRVGPPDIDHNTRVQQARDMIAGLTRREREVLRLLVDGSSNKVAAHELGVSPRTIENHRAHIMDKMNARNISDVVRVAVTAG
jgi:two-component system, LuxR family, response regulator FixJ